MVGGFPTILELPSPSLLHSLLLQKDFKNLLDTVIPAAPSAEVIPFVPIFGC